VLHRTRYNKSVLVGSAERENTEQGAEDSPVHNWSQSCWTRAFSQRVVLSDTQQTGSWSPGRATGMCAMTTSVSRSAVRFTGTVRWMLTVATPRHRQTVRPNRTWSV